MKVSVSSNALCFVLGWIEGVMGGIHPFTASDEVKECFVRIKKDMGEAELTASSGDVENALQSESARLLSENARLRKQFEGAIMDINCLKIHSSQIESENLTLRSVEVQLRKKLKEVNAQLDKLRMEPVQVGQPEKWTARVRDILDRIIAYTETSGYDRGMPLVADLAHEAKMLIACGASGNRNKAIPSLSLLCEAFIGSTNPDKCDRVDVGVRLVNVLRACGLEVSE